MTKEVEDYFRYEIWSYTDGSYDVNALTEDPPINLEKAAIQSALISRTLREECRDTRQIYALEFYENGDTSTIWSKDEDLADNFERFLWSRHKIHVATYAIVHPNLRKLPRWLVTSMATMEYAVAKIYLTWARLTGAAPREDVGTSRTPQGQPPTPKPLDELAEGSSKSYEVGAGNVIWLRPRQR